MYDDDGSPVEQEASDVVLAAAEAAASAAAAAPAPATAAAARGDDDLLHGVQRQLAEFYRFQEQLQVSCRQAGERGGAVSNASESATRAAPRYAQHLTWLLLCGACCSCACCLA